jgi:hypothetical protein
MVQALQVRLYRIGKECRRRMNRVSGRTSRSLAETLRSGLEDAVAVAVVGLVVMGVGGLVYKLLNPDGWLTDWLGRLWEKSPGLVWLVGFVGAVVVIGGKHVYDRNPPGNTTRGNLLVYAFMALGLFFFFKLVVTGAL